MYEVDELNQSEPRRGAQVTDQKSRISGLLHFLCLGHTAVSTLVQRFDLAERGAGIASEHDSACRWRWCISKGKYTRGYTEGNSNRRRSLVLMAVMSEVELFSTLHTTWAVSPDT